MKDNPYRQERDEIKELLSRYRNFKNGKKFNFIEEDSFERIIDYFDENDQMLLAMEAADLGIAQYPYSAMLLIKKADLLIALQKYSEALNILERASLLDSTDINLYILETDAYLALDNQSQAAALLEEALKRFEGQEKIELLFELADVYDDYEDFDKVFDCLQIILKQDPTNEEALYKICFWTDYTHRHEESIVLHQQVIEEHPYSHLAWFNLGAAYQGIKLYEKAIDAYQYAIAIDEKFDYAYRNLGDALIRIRKYREAIEALDKVLELAMPEDVIYEALGYCYDRLRNHAQARFNYRKAVHLKPNDGLLHYKIAGTYMKEGYWGSAINNLTRALTIDRSNPDFHFALALCFEQQDMIKEAVIQFTLYIKSRPKTSKGWKALIQCLYEADYYEEALEQAHNAMSHTEHKPVFTFYKAAILLSLGKSKEGLNQLQEAMTLAPHLLRQFTDLDSSHLQNPRVAAIISNYKIPKKHKKR